MRFVDKTGQKFGRLTVINYAGKRGQKNCWECLCDCGNTTRVASGDLSTQQSGTKSCGCINSDRLKKKNMTHGKSATSEYQSYTNAKQRCESPTNKKYKNYGGRGIKFLFSDFESFYDEVGDKPSKKHTLDRIDVDGHYAPGNVRWATPKEQGNNTTTNRLLTHNGETKTLAEWVGDSTNNRYKTIYARLTYYGWCDSCALTKDSCIHKAKNSVLKDNLRL